MTGTKAQLAIVQGVGKDVFTDIIIYLLKQQTMLKQLLPIENELLQLQSYLQLHFTNIEIKATTEVFGEEYDYFFGEADFGEMDLLIKEIILKKIDLLQTEIRILKLKI